MSYLVAFVTFVCILPLFFFMNKITNRFKTSFNYLSQSERYELVRPYLPQPASIQEDDEEFDIEDEIEEYLEENAVNVVMEGDSIYWVQDNIFYTAQVIGDEVDQDSIQPINTESMSKSELEKMLFILDALKE